jgi:hypothetical protein
MMAAPKWWTVSILLLASALPVFAYAGSGGPKSWFHFRRGGSEPSHNQSNHQVVKHHAAKHPKPLRTSNRHP